MATFRAVRRGPSRAQLIVKRMIDIVVSVFGLILFSWLIFIAWLLVVARNRESGFFRQLRIGRHGHPFLVVKIRTMWSTAQAGTTVTTTSDPRLTPVGRWLRHYKIDELPQLWNVLRGEMSLVGPRPDVPGFADKLVGDDLVILKVRPGMTGPATLKYRDEEALLAGHADPEAHNLNVLWPDKVAINRAYVENFSLRQDFVYLWQTVSKRPQKI